MVLYIPPMLSKRIRMTKLIDARGSAAGAEGMRVR